MSFQVLLSIFPVQVEPPKSVNLSKQNHFFGPKDVHFREVTLYIHVWLEEGQIWRMQSEENWWMYMLIPSTQENRIEGVWMCG